MDPKDPKFSIANIATFKEDADSRIQWVLVDRQRDVWWPALLYESHDLLQRSIPAKEVKLKRAICMERMKYRTPLSKFAILFGNDRPQQRIISIISPDEEADSLKSYFDYVDWAEEKFMNEKGWEQAYTEAGNMLLDTDLTLIHSDFGDVIAMYPGKSHLKDLADFSFPASIVEKMEPREDSRNEVRPLYLKNEEIPIVKCETEEPFSVMNPTMDVRCTNILKATSIGKITGPLNVTRGTTKEVPRSMFSTASSSTCAHNQLQTIKETISESLVTNPTLKVPYSISPKPSGANKRTKEKEYTSAPNPKKSRPALEANRSRKSSRLDDKVEPTPSQTVDKRKRPLRSRNQANEAIIQSTPSAGRQTPNGQAIRTLTPSPSSINKQKKRSGSDRNESSDSGEHKPRKILKDEQFNVVMQILKDDYGWTYKNGTGLHSYYYITPELKGVSMTSFESTYIINKDYFVDEEDLKRHVHNHFGWNGPDGGESLNRNGSSMGRRAPRNRDNDSQNTSDNSVSLSSTRSNRSSRVQDNAIRIQRKRKSNKKAVDHHVKEETPKVSKVIDDGACVEDRVSRNQPKREIHKKAADHRDKQDTPTVSKVVYVSASVDGNAIQKQPKRKNCKKVAIHRDKEVSEVIYDAPNKRSRRKVENSSDDELYRKDCSSQDGDSEKAKDDSSEKENESPMTRQSITPHTNSSKMDADTNNDPNTSMQNKLHECMDLLSPSYVSGSSVYEGTHLGSRFASNKEELMMFLNESIQSYQNDGRGLSSAIYLCGNPGTGKVSFLVLPFGMSLCRFMSQILADSISSIYFLF